MRLRRLFALLTSVTMLHLSVVVGDSACATHGAKDRHGAKATTGEIVAGHEMSMDGHVMPMAERTDAPAVGTVRVATSDMPPCEVPTQQHCCEAVVGCSVASAVTSAHQMLASTTVAATRIRAALHDAPASFASAPEPPPPKA